jgi:hypothetical protein
MTDPGAIEQHIEPAELAHRRCHHVVDRDAVAHIEGDRGRPTAGGMDPRGGGFSRSGVDVGAGDCCAFTRQTFGAGPADAAARTCHQRHFSFDATHRNPPAYPCRGL